MYRVFFKQKTGMAYKEFDTEKEAREYCKHNDWFYVSKVGKKQPPYKYMTFNHNNS